MNTLDTRYDLSLWTERYHQAKAAGYSITLSDSPLSIAHIEYYRNLARQNHSLGPSVRTSVFTFAKGESPHLRHTKIGGIPYYSKKQAWPSDEIRIPYVFLAQFNLTEQNDLSLPGQLLLVFGMELNSVFGKIHALDTVLAEGRLFFVWQDLDHHSDEENVTANDLPKTEIKFQTAYGVRHDTVDYLESQYVAEIISSYIPAEAFGSQDEREGTTLSMARFRSNKIGGIPPAECPSLNNSSYMCTLGSITLHAKIPFPWVNLPDPLSDYKVLNENAFRTFEMTVLDLYYSAERGIEWRGGGHEKYIQDYLNPPGN